MAEPFLGSITGFAGTFAPRGWAFCDGQLLAISQYDALFSLLGTIYGGDGRTTFGLPDLRGRTNIHPGQGPGLTSIALGQKGGVENVTLSQNNMAGHSHAGTLHAENKAATVALPAGSMLGRTGADTIYAPPDPAANVAMAPDAITVANTGGGSPVNVRGPFLGVHMIIALVGIYPSRN